MIFGRLDAISEIGESMGSSQASQDIKNLGAEDVQILKSKFNQVLYVVLITLGRTPDIQREITRIFHRTAMPTEFIVVIQAILHAGKQLQQLHSEEDEESNGCLSATNGQSEILRKLILTAPSPIVIKNAAKLLFSLSKDAADQRDLQNLVISGDQFLEVVRARQKVQLAKEKLDFLITLYHKQLRMSKLEFICVFGMTHLIELPIDVKNYGAFLERGGAGFGGQIKLTGFRNGDIDLSKSLLTYQVGAQKVVKNWWLFLCLGIGLWAGLIRGFVTEYYTGSAYRPVQGMAESCTNVIFGLVLGYKAVIIPTFANAVRIFVSFSFGAMYGIVVAALGMLSTIATGLVINAYGPINVNTGSITELASMSHVFMSGQTLWMLLFGSLRCLRK